MLITRKNLIKLISREKRRIDEACGCDGGSDGQMSDIRPLNGYEPMHDEPEWDEESEEEFYPEVVTNKFLTREEALKSVTALAMVTTCPVTQKALLSVVQELM